MEELEPTITEIHEIIRKKRILRGEPLVYTPKRTQNKDFLSNVRYLIGMYGVIPYRVK